MPIICFLKKKITIPTGYGNQYAYHKSVLNENEQKSGGGYFYDVINKTNILSIFLMNLL
jgi:hypothetical protein